MSSDGENNVKEGSYDEALKKFEQALELFKEVPEDLSNFDVARTLRSIGDVYVLQGKEGNHDKALEKFEKALELFKKVPGDLSNVDVARTLRRIGNVRARINISE